MGFNSGFKGLMSMADEWNIKMEQRRNDSDRGSPKYSEKMLVQLLSKIRVIIRHLCDINPWIHCLAVVMERHQYATRLIGTVTKFHPLHRWYYYSHNNHREKRSVAVTSNTTYRTLYPLNCCNIQGPFIQDNCTSAINETHGTSDIMFTYYPERGMLKRSTITNL